MKDTDKLDLKIRWIALVVTLILPILAVFMLIYAMFVDFLKGSFSIVGSLIWLSLILTSLYLVSAVVNEITITVNRQGIYKRFLFWQKSIRWEDIIATNTALLAGNAWKFTVYSPDTTIVINLFFFKNVAMVVRTIENNLPEKIKKPDFYDDQTNIS